MGFLVQVECFKRVPTLRRPAGRAATYTEQVFLLADGLSPDAKAILDTKVERLIAGPTSPPVPAGQNSLVYFVDTTAQANVFLTCYTSAVAALALDPSLVAVDLPINLSVAALYGR